MELPTRLFDQFLVELRRVTKPEIAITALFALAVFLFKYFFAGGVTLEDWSSLVVPTVWVGSGTCGFYLVQAARHLYADEVTAWEAWKPAIPEADFLRPKRPPVKPIIAVTTVSCLCLLALIVATFVTPHSAPQTRAHVAAELTELAQNNQWDLLAKRLSSIESDPNLHDLGLYFRGMLYEDAIEKGSLAPDPERYLSQVSQESEFFSDAQRLRLHDFALTHNPELKIAIIKTLDRANLRNPVYYTLRLEPPPTLSYREIAALYSEFMERHSNVFDFNEMTPRIRGRVGVYMEADLNDQYQVPACVLLFLLRELQTARSECRKEPLQSIWDSYENLTKHISDAQFAISLRHFAIDPNTRRNIEQLRDQPLPSRCNNNRPTVPAQ